MLCGVCMVMDVMWGLYSDGCYVGFVRSWMLCEVCTVMDVRWGLYSDGCYVGFVL